MTEIDWMKQFGSNLKFLLKDRRMSQKELSDIAWISEASISKYINGVQMPTIPALINIGYALECDVEELINFDEEVL